MKVVVTGAAGFIGSHVVDQLVHAGHDVVAVDNLDPRVHAGRPDWLNGSAEWVWEDVQNSAMWPQVLQGADAVSHQAAWVGLGVDFADVGSYVWTNDGGTAAMLGAMHASGFDGRLVLASSMVVYGEGRYRCAEHGVVRPGPRDPAAMDAGDFEPPCPVCGAALQWELVPEDAPADPRNVYAATKLHQEHLCAAYAREHASAVTALRYHNVYGARMPRDTPYAGVMSIFRSALAAGRPPAVFEDGGQRRDFVHVSDVARANVAALTCAEPFDGALNVASGTPCTLLGAAEALCTADGRGLDPEVVGGYRLGDVRHVVADPSRAVGTIGFQASVAPADGFAMFAADPLRDPPAR